MINITQIKKLPSLLLILFFSTTALLMSQDTPVAKLTDGIEKDGIFSGYAFADNIAEYDGKEIKSFSREKALNGVFGKGDDMGSLDVFVVGEGNYVVFEWKGKKVVNSKGDDIKVFENGFYIAGTKNRMALDLGTVEVSKDGENWISFPVSYDETQFKNSNIGKTGFVGTTPVYLNMESSNEMINDPSLEEAGGDGFDLSEIGLEEGDYIKYVKVIDGGSAYPDGQIASNGIDIDGVCAFYWVNE